MNTMTDPPVASHADDNPYKSSTAALDDPNLQYRSLNRAALGSVMLFVLGLTGLLFWQLLILPLAGILLGYSGYRTIRRYPDEYTGLRLARAGMALCALLIAGGFGYHAFVYATEVPEGYQRVGFYELQPEAFSMEVLPKRAFELRGEKIFLKGYVHPGVSGMGKVDQFVLVPDMSTCCFGGQPKLTDMILVKTTPDSRVTYAPRMIRVAGKFDIGDHVESLHGVENVVYRLDADYSK